MGRPRKPLWSSGHRGFESHSLRHERSSGPHRRFESHSLRHVWSSGPHRRFESHSLRRMSTAKNGDVEIYYERFGDPADSTLVLVNGLGSQCTNYTVEWVELFVAEGYRVLRLDNRDTGLSSKLEGVDYTLADMADDVVAVLDAEGVDRAHVMGLSMGGMIVQRLAIDHPDRLLTMTSVMSRTGEPGYGDSTPEALELLLAPPA